MQEKEQDHNLLEISKLKQQKRNIWADGMEVTQASWNSQPREGKAVNGPGAECSPIPKRECHRLRALA